MLEKLSEVYISLVATMNTKWISYTSTNLRETIYKISRFLKADPLKVFHASSTPVSSHSNKHTRLNSDNSALPVCSHPICHPIDKYWELHPEQRPANRRKKIELSDIKIKGIAFSAVKDDTLTFNIS